MPSPPLPFELLRLILDQFDPSRLGAYGSVHELDYSTIASLCLTSKLFRQISQPYLFAIVVVDGRDAQEALSKLWENNKSNGLLMGIRYLAPEEGEHHDSGTESEEEEAEDLLLVSESLLQDLTGACPNLEDLVCNWPGVPIAGFSGAAIRRLCLEDANVAACDSTFCLPSLQYLSLVETSFPAEAFTLKNFPTLRHLAFYKSRGEYFSNAITNLAQLASQIDSVLFSFDVALTLLDHIPSFLVDSLLIDFSRAGLLHFPQAANRVKHVRIRGTVIDEITSEASAFVTALNHVANIVSNPSASPKLASIYLPPLETFEIGLMPMFTRLAIDRLLLACQKRNIEIVYEAQPIGIDARTQFSSEFMRRMTKERIRREGFAKKGGNDEGQA